MCEYPIQNVGWKFWWVLWPIIWHVFCTVMFEGRDEFFFFFHHSRLTQLWRFWSLPSWWTVWILIFVVFCPKELFIFSPMPSTKTLACGPVVARDRLFHIPCYLSCGRASETFRLLWPCIKKQRNLTLKNTVRLKIIITVTMNHRNQNS